MKDFFSKLMGQGWVTSLIGYLIIAMEVGKVAFLEQGLPSSTEGWIEFGGAVALGTVLRSVKDPSIIQRILGRVPQPPIVINAVPPAEPPKV